MPIELVPKLATTSTGTMSPLRLGLQFIDLRIPWAPAAMIPLRNWDSWMTTDCCSGFRNVWAALHFTPFSYSELVESISSRPKIDNKQEEWVSAEQESSRIRILGGLPLCPRRSSSGTALTIAQDHSLEVARRQMSEPRVAVALSCGECLHSSPPQNQYQSCSSFCSSGSQEGIRFASA